MLTFSKDPEVAEQQMNAIIFYMTAFGYIDGDFDLSEKAFVREYIGRLVEKRAEDAMPNAAAAVRAEVVQRFVTHFHEVFEEIDAEVRGLFDEVVADDASTPSSSSVPTRSSSRSTMPISLSSSIPSKS